MLDSKLNMSFLTQFSKSTIGDILWRLRTNDLQYLRVDYNIPSDVFLIVPNHSNQEDLVKPG